MSDVPRLPSDLTERDQWVLWRYQTRNGKRTKVPYEVNGKPAKSDDPQTWNTFQAVTAAWTKAPERYQGIGFMFANADPFAGIDFDDCMDQGGALKPWAGPIIRRFADTYMEISPSGRGVKVWVKARLEGPGHRAAYQDGAVEIYDRGRFFTVTGRTMNGAPLQVQEHQADIAKLYALISGGTTKRPKVKADLKEQKTVAEGKRYEYLQSAAAQYRAKGMDRQEIYAALAAINQRRCIPPKPDSVLRELADWAATLEPGKRPLVQMPAPESTRTASGSIGAPELLSQHFSDYGNAQRVITLHGADLRYCHAFNKWLVWDGQRWVVDDGERARDLSQHTILEFARQALAAKNETAAKFAAGCLNSQRISNALREAQPHLAIRPAELDTHPDVLNFLNGTVDLRTGGLRPHRREDFITKVVHHDYRPGAKCPLFLAFLERVTANHPGLIGYLQKAVGYSVTARTIEKAVFLLHGRGDNGKSTLLTAFLKILEEYGVLLQIDTLMVRPESNNSQADLADLRGARFAMTSETEEGQRLAEGKLKRISQGMGRIKATRKYENPVEFPESHKLWIDANHLPIVRGTDSAIWNRLHPIPFDTTIPKDEQDKELPAKLAAEAEGILAWAVAGAARWYAEGLGKPSDVQQAGDTWRAQSDRLGRFIAEYCITGDFVQAKARALYSAYRTWAEEAGERTLTETDFSNALMERDFSKKHTKIGAVYSGIGLAAETREGDG